MDVRESRAAARVQIVEEHVRAENAHDLDAVMSTFGETARYDDEPWDAHHLGRAGVGAYYSDIMRSLPDMHIEVVRRYVTEDNIILEVIIHGTHLGPWRGLPATGRRVAIPLCAIYTFDSQDRLAGERIYYVRALALRQLGVFFEPQSPLGQITTALTHPATMLRIFLQWIKAS